jgi:hypothetical protein
MISVQLAGQNLVKEVMKPIVILTLNPSIDAAAQAETVRP